MLNIEQLSYWERKSYFEEIDFLIIGAGIVGFSSALELKKKYPDAKIVVIERGYLPTGASSKNAGFACFGSATELLDDLTKIPEDQVWSTTEKRWQGLQNLISIIGEEHLDFQQHGSWDLILPSEKESISEIRDKIDYLNNQIEKITSKKNVYSEDKDLQGKFGFANLETSFNNNLEGQIDTGKMIRRFHQLAMEKGILTLFGITIQGLQPNLYNVGVQSSVGYFKVRNVLICTNGFAKQFLPTYDVNPARAQVLVTTPIENLKVKGTFHYNQGYYYFRNIDGRILLGGGRNLDIKGETTTDLHTTEMIMESLNSLLKNVILPDQHYAIEYQWAGIMGVGKTKTPIIEKIDDKIGVGVRMGGMGVAIGSLVGKELAEEF